MFYTKKTDNRSINAKTKFIVFVVLMLAAFSLSAIDVNQESQMHNMMHKDEPDARISLNLNPMQKRHQLKNMRSHVEAVQTIIDLISRDKYAEASQTAHNKLGLTAEMKMMCSAFGNDDFTKIGLAFHKSADKLGEVLLTKDTNKSLTALSNTMTYCVSCHATFRQ